MIVFFSLGMGAIPWLIMSEVLLPVPLQPCLIGLFLYSRFLYQIPLVFLPNISNLRDHAYNDLYRILSASMSYDTVSTMSKISDSSTKNQRPGRKCCNYGQLVLLLGRHHDCSIAASLEQWRFVPNPAYTYVHCARDYAHCLIILYCCLHV